mmetsp:Transcript_28487/g.48392  ORF Transcript_28487/g.48392 Transcript_28487/m.48392 type:complete len:212 (+) Transcript_28487:760-1395(+)
MEMRLRNPFKKQVVTGDKFAFSGTPHTSRPMDLIFFSASCTITQPSFSAMLSKCFTGSIRWAFIVGMLRAACAAPPLNTSRICSHTSTATFTWASCVDAPKWGVVMMLSHSSRGDSLARGSGANTSRAARATCPLLTASATAASSTHSPRATLARITPFFIVAMVVALIIFCVSLMEGRCRVITSAAAKISLISAMVTCSLAPCSAVTNGS